MNRLLTIALLALMTGACSTLQSINPFADTEESAWKDEVRNWRQARVHKLTQPDGWLTLVGLDWLREGEQTVGSAADNDIVLSGGPARWGSVTLRDEQVHFNTAPGVDVRVDGQLVNSARLVADDEGEASIVSSGTVQFYVVRRGSLALRVKDSTAATRTNFQGLDYFPMTMDWRVVARFEPHPPGTTLEIVNVQGQIEHWDNPGVAVFEKGGKSFRIEMVLEEGEDELFVIIADRTSGKETYGAARFMYAPMPKNGYTVLDFNKTYNPPCAFTVYSTCALPPPSNRMNIRVEAGELKYQGQPGYRPGA